MNEKIDTGFKKVQIISSLVASHKSEVDLEYYLSFLEQCSQLLHINLTGSSVGNLEGVNYCKNLETLNLRWCQGIQDISQIRECNQLKKLYLCHLDRVRDLKPLES